MKPEFVRNPYNYDSDQHSTDTGLLCLDESLTEQEHLEETDINYIADRFMKTGHAPQIINMPTYGDFEGVFDFQSAMNIITEAKHEFMSLPAKVRSRFNNDPHELIQFIEDPANRDEAIKLGFIRQPDTITTQSTSKENTDGTGSRGTTEGNTQDASRTAGTGAATQKGQEPSKT